MKKPAASLPFATRFEPRNRGQFEAQGLWPTSDVLFFVGPPGAGKTLCAVALAALDVAEGRAEKIVLLRANVEADRSVGYLPGTLTEKVEPFMAPALQALRRVSYQFPAEKLSLEALGFVKGITYTSARVIVDEAQDLHYDQFRLVVTRLGLGSKIIFCGDPEQSSIRSRVADYDTELECVLDDLEGTAGVGVVEWTDDQVVRHPRLKALLRRFSPRGV